MATIDRTTVVMGGIAAEARRLIALLQQSVRMAEEMHRTLDDSRGGSCGDAVSTEIAVDTSSDGVAGLAGVGEVIQVYWIGCAGLQRAARRLGPEVRIDRIGTSTERDLADRLSAAAADAYGSWTRDAGGRLLQEPGFSAWVMQAIRTTRGSIDAAIAVKARSIAVALPHGMTRRGFDRALHVALEGWSLARAHPGARRFTNYSVGVDRMSRAIELYTGLDPRRDGDRLLALVEGILATHRARKGSTNVTVALMGSSPPSPAPRDAEPAPAPSPRRRMTPAQFEAMQWRLSSLKRRCAAP